MSALVRRILLAALALGVLVDVLVPGNAAGINGPLVVAAVLGAAILIAGREGLHRVDPADVWLAPVAIVLAAMSAIRADDWLVTFDLLLAGALAAGAIGCLAGGRVTRALVPRVVDLAAGAAAAAGVGAAAILSDDRRDRPAGEAEGSEAWSRVRPRVRAAMPIARGLVIAFPVTVVFLALFASADAVFARLAADALAWRPDVDIAGLVGRALVITVVAWMATGLLGLGAGLLPAFQAGTRPTEDVLVPTPAGGVAPAIAASATGAPPPPPARAGVAGAPVPWPAPGGWAPGTPTADRARLRVGSTEAAIVLVAVDALFAIFVLLQLAYLFGGRDTLAVSGLTYAEYARRGFFDLVIVAALAGMLVVVLDAAASRRSRARVAASLLLLALTGVVVVSAFLRLRLYQEAYGWTELRFVVLTGILWLAAALLLTAGLLLAHRTRWTLHALGILALVAVGGMNVVGPQAFVAERNLERAADPSLVPDGGRTGLDAGYLRELGDEAVVPVVEAWPRLGAADRADLEPVLEERAAALASAPELLGWPAWNLTRERAREALRAWEPARGAASR